MSFYPNFTEGNNYVKDLFDAFYAFLNKNASNKRKLELFYNSCVSDFSENIINLVVENCIGYLLVREIPLNKCNTINELLHVMHQTIVNDENIFNNMPNIDTKINDYNYPIYLCGKETSWEKIFLIKFL